MRDVVLGKHLNGAAGRLQQTGSARRFSQDVSGLVHFGFLFFGQRTTGAAVGFGGKTIRTVFRLGLFKSSEPAIVFSPRGGRGGGTLGCGFGGGCESFFILNST